MRDYYDPYVLDALKRNITDSLRERNWVIADGELFVRIPKGKEVQNRIYRYQAEGKDEILVDLICETWYDKKAKQSRNRKTRIGRISPFFPNAMIANGNYEKYFDRETGKLLNPLRDPEEVPEEIQVQSAPVPAETRQDSLEQYPEEKSIETSPPTPREATQAEKDEVINENFRKSLEDLDRFTKKRKREELEKKLRGEEAERRRELFGDMPQQEDIETAEARKHLESVIRKIQAEYPDQYPQHNTDTTDEHTEGAMTGYDTTPDANPTKEEAEEQRLTRLAVLNQILRGIKDSIRLQAKKKPDAIVNTYKARSINRILSEIRDQYEGSGYTDLLTLVEEPAEEEQDGRIILTGMTYSDTEVLLEHYAAIVRFIKSKSTEKHTLST